MKDSSSSRGLSLHLQITAPPTLFDIVSQVTRALHLQLVTLRLWMGCLLDTLFFFTLCAVVMGGGVRPDKDTKIQKQS